jgi:hypothetical protein
MEIDLLCRAHFVDFLAPLNLEGRCATLAACGYRNTLTPEAGAGEGASLFARKQHRESFSSALLLRLAALDLCTGKRTPGVVFPVAGGEIRGTAEQLRGAYLASIPRGAMQGCWALSGGRGQGQHV